MNDLTFFSPWGQHGQLTYGYPGRNFTTTDGYRGAQPQYHDQPQYNESQHSGQFQHPPQSQNAQRQPTCDELVSILPLWRSRPIADGCGNSLHRVIPPRMVTRYGTVERLAMVGFPDDLPGAFDELIVELLLNL